VASLEHRRREARHARVASAVHDEVTERSSDAEGRAEDERSFDSESPLPSFADVLERYYNDILGYCRRRIGDPHLAEDIAQETFLRAFRAATVIDSGRPLWPWLQVIARNLIANTVRNERRLRRHLASEVDIEALVTKIDERLEGDPDRWLMDEHDRIAITDSLQVLSPRQRRMLLKRVLHGVTYEQLARAEGISVDAAKSLVKRGRRSFRTAYQSRIRS
jgi:RNA polymerase sigma factor (sigma-70 family)